MLYTALYQITGNREYLKKINLLCEYENSLYSEEKADAGPMKNRKSVGSLDGWLRKSGNGKK